MSGWLAPQNLPHSNEEFPYEILTNPHLVFVIHQKCALLVRPGCNSLGELHAKILGGFRATLSCTGFRRKSEVMMLSRNPAVQSLKSRRPSAFMTLRILVGYKQQHSFPPGLWWREVQLRKGCDILGQAVFRETSRSYFPGNHVAGKTLKTRRRSSANPAAEPRAVRYGLRSHESRNLYKTSRSGFL